MRLAVKTKLCLALWVCGSGVCGLWAALIPVPNPSFESPVTPFVNTHVDGWQKTPKPDWYVEGGGYTWDQLAGVFLNTPAGAFDHINNCDGNQALYLFAVPQAGIFQDYNSTDWSNSTPTHAFSATYETGTAYKLTVGVIGGGGNMAPGATLELGLYYRDAASNQVIVTAASITNTPELFSNTVTLVDFIVSVPTVQAGEPWAGQHIGVRFLSTVDSSLQGGYWDVDNVRLTGIRQPVWANPFWSAGGFSLTLESEPGLRFEILANSDPSSPTSNWDSLGTLSNASGRITFIDPATNVQQRFYRARQLQ